MRRTRQELQAFYDEQHRRRSGYTCTCGHDGDVHERSARMKCTEYMCKCREFVSRPFEQVLCFEPLEREDDCQ